MHKGTIRDRSQPPEIASLLSGGVRTALLWCIPRCQTVLFQNARPVKDMGLGTNVADPQFHGSALSIFSGPFDQHSITDILIWHDIHL
jgi:hypothetical protein